MLICSSHKTFKEFSNIKILFLPTNSTSVIQPMDQEVIATLKAYYRKVLMKKIVDTIDQNTEFDLKLCLDQITLLDSLHYLSDAWNLISEETIKNTWNNSGLVLETVILENKFNAHLEELDNEFIYECSLLDNEISPFPEDDNLSVGDFCSQDDQIEESDDLVEFEQKESRASILQAIFILKKTMKEYSLPIYEELREIENKYQMIYSKLLSQQDIRLFYH